LKGIIKMMMTNCTLCYSKAQAPYIFCFYSHCITVLPSIGDHLVLYLLHQLVLFLTHCIHSNPKLGTQEKKKSIKNVNIKFVYFLTHLMWSHWYYIYGWAQVNEYYKHSWAEIVG
jgi:hypothetical protein